MQEQLKQVSAALERPQHQQQPPLATEWSAVHDIAAAEGPSPLTQRIQSLTATMQAQEGLASANTSRLRELEQAAAAGASGSAGGVHVASALSPVRAGEAPAGYQGRTPSLDQLQSVKMSV